MARKISDGRGAAQASGQYRLVAEHLGGGATQSGTADLNGLRGIHRDITSPVVHITRR